MKKDREYRVSMTVLVSERDADVFNGDWAAAAERIFDDMYHDGQIIRIERMDEPEGDEPEDEA